MGVSEENFRRVCVQRDCLAKALGRLIDTIRNGVYNHMLPDVNPRAMHTEVDAKTKCPKGHTRRDVMWSMGLCCLKCDDHHCRARHLSFEERGMFEAMDVASEILNRPDGEMPDIKPEDFVVYRPDLYTYEATSTWIARNIYKFVVGYWFYSDHSDKEMERKWERAFDDTIAICLGVYGKVYKTLVNACKSVKSAEDADKFAAEHPEVKEFIEIIQERYESKSLYDITRDKHACVYFKTTMLVAYAVKLRLDYRFGHDYPGADMGVYGDAFDGLILLCLSIAGLYDDQDEYFEHDAAGIVAEAEHNADRKSKIFAFMAIPEGLCVHTVDGGERGHKPRKTKFQSGPDGLGPSSTPPQS